MKHYMRVSAHRVDNGFTLDTSFMEGNTSTEQELVFKTIEEVLAEIRMFFGPNHENDIPF